MIKGFQEFKQLANNQSIKMINPKFDESVNKFKIMLVGVEDNKIDYMIQNSKITVIDTYTELNKVHFII